MRKRWRTWAAGLVAGAMIASSVQMPVYADMASDVEWLTAGNDEEPAESGADFWGIKKLPIATDTEAGRRSVVIEEENWSVATDTEADYEDEDIPEEEIPEDEEFTEDGVIPGGEELPGFEILPATPTEIPVETVLPVATPAVPVMLAMSQDIDLSQATTVITIEQDGEYTFTGTWDESNSPYYGTDGHVITVKENVKADITFQGVTIKNSNYYGYHNVVNLEAGAKVTLTLAGINQLIDSSVSGAAIHVPSGATLTIKGGEDDRLLVRSRSYGAGIGGNSNEGAGTIIINGGNIYATAGYTEDDEILSTIYSSAAGIGGGEGNNAGTIEIHGGSVLARSAKSAGIGDGKNNLANNFTVYTESEIARIGIRGSENAKEIKVLANSSQKITDQGTIVQVEYGEPTSYAVFKVTSKKGNDDGIEVRGNGSVALRGTGPYTISMLDPSKEVTSRVIQIKSACTVTLDGIKMDASTMQKNPPIDIDSGLDGVTLILNGKNYIKGAELTSAIDNHGTPLMIKGDGSLTAIAGSGSAAIGGSVGQSGNHITIAGGNLTLYGASGSACIGGGDRASGTDIEISGGVVHLIQKNPAYLLGGSRSYGTTEGICISGGEVIGMIEYQGDPQYNSMAKISGDPIKIQASNGQGATVYAGASSPGEVVFGTTTEGIYTFQDSDWYMHVVYGEPYSLTVTDGKITDPKSVGYAHGERVFVTAEKEKDGQYFYKWEVTSGSGTFENPDSENTTFIMGNENTVITARYKGESTVTVINGTKSPDQETYAPGTQVTITASSAETGKYFDSWEMKSGTGSTLADAKMSTTTLTVGKEDTVVEAIYKSGPVLTVNRGSGSGTYAPGDQIKIQAKKGDNSETFLGWILESGSGTFANPSWESTTFTIGSEDTVITAQYYLDTGDFVVTGGQYGVDYSFEGKNEWGLLTITGSGTYDISLKEGIGDTTQQILVEKGTPTMILHDVRMVSYGTMEIRGTKVKLILDGENSFESTGYTNSFSALNGIAVTQKGSVEITSINGDGSTEGSLYAKGNRQYGGLDHGYAGIGGSAEQIVIKGGTIYAEGSNEGPGIGNNGALDKQSISEPVKIVITGGQVTAVGKNAPGIGNGERNLGAATVHIADGLKIQEGASASQLAEVSAADMAGGASKPYVEITPSGTGEPSIRILSAPKAVYRGEQTQLRAAVTGALADQVQWEVTGGSSEATKIRADGLLTVGAQESMGTLTIKAILRESGKNTSITVPVQDRMVTLSLDQTEIAVGGTVTATATVSGTGVEEITGRIRFYLDGAPVGSILTLEEGKAFYTIPAKLLSGGKHLVSAVYTNGDVRSESNEVEVLVNKKPVTVSKWPEFETTSYFRKSLKDLTVKTSGKASMEGTFRFKENNQYPEIGTHSYEMVFVPTNTSYGNVEGTAAVTVSKGALVSAPYSGSLVVEGSSVYYGQKLSDSKLRVTRGYLANGRGQEVEGSWRWKEPDKILGKGRRSADAVYEVSDQEHYEDYPENIGIYVDFTTPEVSLMLSANEAAAGKTISVSAKAENPYNRELNDVPEPVITYQIGQDGQLQTVTNGTITIPKDTAVGTSIAVMASTANSENYNAANKQMNVTVIQKRDISANLSITVKNTTYGGVILPQGSIRNGSSDGTANWTYQYRTDASQGWSDDIPKKVGAYEIKGIYEDESQVGEVTKTFQIVPRTLTVTDAELKEKSYDGTTSAEVLSVTFAGMADGDTVRKTDYTAEAVFADAKAGAGKTAVLQVKLNETPSMANYVLKETQVSLHGKQIQKAEAPVLETQKAIYLTSARGERKITLTGLPADCGEISGGRAVIQSDAGGILEQTVRMDGGQLVIRFNKNSREQAGSQAQIMIYDLVMENYKSVEISLCVELQDDPNQKPDLTPDPEPAPDTGGGNSGSGSGNSGSGSGNTGGGSGNTGSGSGNTGGGSGNTGGGSGNTGSGSGNSGSGSGNTGSTGGRGHNHEHDEKRITNSDRTTWIFTGRKWRLRRPNRTYARGKIVSQSLAEGMLVQYQWELVNGRWYAFDEQGYLKTGLFYDAGYDGWFYVDENTGMKTGWIQINGKWYYFKDVSDGTRGIMLKNQKTPDGYFVDENGVWKQ